MRPSRYGKRTTHHTEGNSQAAKDICGDIDVRQSQIKAALRVSQYQGDRRSKVKSVKHMIDDHEYFGELNSDSKPHGQGQKIMKNHDYDHWEFSGEFKEGEIFNGDELMRHKGGAITLFVYEDGKKVTKVTGNDNSDEEVVEDLTI